MANMSKSTFLHPLWYLRDQQPWSSGFYTSWSNKSLRILQLGLWQKIQPLHLWEECLEAQCNPNIHCSAPFDATFLYTRMPVLWVCTFFWRTKRVSLSTPIKESSQLLSKFYISRLKIQYNARHSVSKVDKSENGRQKELYVKTE